MLGGEAGVRNNVDVNVNVNSKVRHRFGLLLGAHPTQSAPGTGEELGLPL